LGTTAEIINPIVLFDGECRLCNYAVNLIISEDSSGYYKFASLKADVARGYLAKEDIDPIKIDSLVLIKEDHVFIKSKAVFKILETFSLKWRWLLIFSYLPTSITDYFYDIIARNRYFWFGKSAKCEIPTSDYLRRFLD
jgi:predicted DCC family thiol-disulfide oxidoreductase YuxK